MAITAQSADGQIHEFPDGTNPAVVDKAMKQYALARPQPSISDRIVASPVGRLANVGAQVLDGVMSGPMNLARAFGGATIPETFTGAEKPYQAALARNRNTPAYAQQRAEAEAALTARGGSGFTDQVMAPLMPAMAGIAGLPRGLDRSNAEADAQTAAMNEYSTANPKMALTANVLGGFMASPEGVAARVPAQALPRVSAVKPFAAEANKAGYTLPPRMITDKPGVTADVLAGWSGKVKTAQAASAKNQEVTNALTAKAIGLPEDAVLTDQVLKGVRQNASKAYSNIPKALPKVTVDPDFYAAVNKLGEKSSAAASEFPELLENAEIDKLVKSLSGKTEFSTDAGISLVRKLRKDASANFRSMGDPAKADLAFAQRQAADAVDDLIERQLDLTGQGQLAAEYRNARQIIAKTHDIEAVTNTTTGNVSARKIAALANRGRPLSGDLKTIADTANAFPKAMQSEAAFGEVEPLSVLDAAGAVITTAQGNPSAAGMFLGRPVARGAVLSKVMQDRIIRNAAKSGARQPMLQMPMLPQQRAIPYGLLGSGALLPRNQ